MDVQEIVQSIQKGSTPMTAAETRRILDTIRSEAETQLHAVMVGVLMHHRANSMAKELEVLISDAEATAQTAAQRVSRLQQDLDQADLAVRRGKAAKIMLPGTASPADLARADQAIQDAERELRRAEHNLQAGRNVTVQRKQELDDLRTVHRALAGVRMPDVTLIRALFDAIQSSP